LVSVFGEFVEDLFDGGLLYGVLLNAQPSLLLFQELEQFADVGLPFDLQSHESLILLQLLDASQLCPEFVHEFSVHSADLHELHESVNLDLIPLLQRVENVVSRPLLRDLKLIFVNNVEEVEELTDFLGSD
jgi:hypothetical protein